MADMPFPISNNWSIQLVELTSLLVSCIGIYNVLCLTYKTKTLGPEC